VPLSSRSSCSTPLKLARLSNGTPAVSAATRLVIPWALSNPAVGILITPRAVFDKLRTGELRDLQALRTTLSGRTESGEASRRCW
jgi:hypothetical protein